MWYIILQLKLKIKIENLNQISYLAIMNINVVIAMTNTSKWKAQSVRM